MIKNYEGGVAAVETIIILKQALMNLLLLSGDENDPTLEVIKALLSKEEIEDVLASYRRTQKNKK